MEEERGWVLVMGSTRQIDCRLNWAHRAVPNGLQHKKVRMANELPIHSINASKSMMRHNSLLLSNQRLCVPGVLTTRVLLERVL